MSKFKSALKIERPRLKLVQVRKLLVGLKSIGLTNVIFVDQLGLSGGLALCWKDSLDVSLCSFSRYHIDALVKETNGGGNWRFPGFYCHHLLFLGRNHGIFLRTLANQYNLPWVCIRDDNLARNHGDPHAPF